jgi:hypothetical protein
LIGPFMNWRRTASFIAVFSVGTLFGNLAIPILFRDELVLTIDGSAPEGCKNYFGLSPFRFGVYRGHGDGTYHIACDDRFEASDTVQLHCHCR